MSKIYWFKRLFGTLLITCCLVFAASIFAQSAPGSDLAVSPATFDLTAKPGDRITQKFRIRNNSDAPVNLDIKLNKLEINPDSHQPVPTPIEADDPFASWIHLDVASVSAKPKEWTDVQYEINVPSNAAFGYYYAFRISPSKDEADSGIGTQVRTEVVLPLLLTVGNQAMNAKGQIDDFSTKQNLYQFMPVNFETTVSNVGNVYIHPKGNIFIESGGKDVAVLEVNPQSGAVLPGASKKFESNWTGGFFEYQPVIEDGQPKMDDKGNQVKSFKINWNKVTDLRIGKYVANLVLVYDDGHKDVSLQSSVSFWVIPYVPILIILGIILLMFLIHHFYLKWYFKKRLEKYLSKHGYPTQ
jgi:hypothetical protein